MKPDLLAMCVDSGSESYWKEWGNCLGGSEIQELGDFPSESWGSFTEILAVMQSTLRAHQMKAKNIMEGSLV